MTLFSRSVAAIKRLFSTTDGMTNGRGPFSFRKGKGTWSLADTTRREFVGTLSQGGLSAPVYREGKPAHTSESV